MKFTKLIITAIFAIFLSSNLYAEDWKEGVHYTVNNSPNSLTKNTVIEWYWIGCPHCQTLEPILNEWANSDKPNEVEFKQFEALFSKEWGRDAAIIALYKKAGELTHEDKMELFRKRISDSSAFYKEANDLLNNIGSTDEENVKIRTEIADELVRGENVKLTQYYARDISSVPYVLVNGSYAINSKNVAQEDFPALIDYLLSLKQLHRD